jgi:hypothetical protein
MTTEERDVLDRDALIAEIARRASYEFGITEEEAVQYAQEYLKKIEHYQDPNNVRELLKKLRR